MNTMNANAQKAWDVYYKNASVGAYAIGLVIDQTKHPTFRRLLEKQLKAYREQENTVLNAYTAAGKKPPEHTLAAKLCTDMGIRMHTIRDRSDSNLAKLMVEGTNMGVITLLQTLHRTKDLPRDVREYGDSILKRENAYMESLKKFL